MEMGPEQEPERIIYTGLDLLTSSDSEDLNNRFFAEKTRFSSGEMRLVIAPGTQLKLLGHGSCDRNPTSVTLNIGNEAYVEVPLEQFLKAKFY